MPRWKTFFFFGHRGVILPEMDGALQLFPPQELDSKKAFF